MAFRKIAHAFPEALGNRYLVHPAECDECNEKGSVLEDALAKHLSVQRAVARIRGKKGAVKYRFWKRPSSIVSDRKSNLVTFETVEGDDSVWATRVPGAIRYHVRVPPYSPEKAVKAVARIGLFLAPSAILPKLEHIRKWVSGELEFSPEFLEGWVPGPGLRQVSALDVYFPESNEHQVLNFLVSVAYGSTLLSLELPAEDGSQLRASPPHLKSPYPPHDVITDFS